jgi:hypothetical protein
MEALMEYLATDAFVPSGAKAPVFPGALMAGLKPRPFKAGLRFLENGKKTDVHG